MKELHYNPDKLIRVKFNDDMEKDLSFCVIPERKTWYGKTIPQKIIRWGDEVNINKYDVWLDKETSTIRKRRYITLLFEDEVSQISWFDDQNSFDAEKERILRAIYPLGGRDFIKF